ncbi:uncharacterized protein M421DRAFT_138657 [Didymella exigua CBS 183.55]|uniref:Heterokaryon incompatibility domain-containing protein n=1 Tax=Didymella exigua CBS 183.55 TaxID=1150837 RepID=A0A6A5RLX7_9PLEO|nr:uncharacterized protein M421DRAFT_138657 [Didymella exigua CBS 183.55]KAF1929425.1 hypothetical protein M421DRAFT_138657 [Didymella exigua CBS 183.55]
MEPYAYKSLNKGEIRLLRLHPKNSIGSLSGSLIHVPLTNPTYCEGSADSEPHLEHPYPYDAISYTWGTDARKPFSLVIDHNRTIGITAHLHYVLQKIVQSHTSVLIWVDAICINQANQDSEEKSQQILLMPDIYRISKRVQIHLGPEANDSPLAIKFLEHMAEYAEYLDESLNVSNSEAYALALEMGYSPPVESDKTWNALRSFWLRPWFRRIWVTQELVNALDPVIHCGDLEIDWRTLWLAARVFQNNNRLMETGLTIFTHHIGVDALEGANSYYAIADMRLRTWGYMSSAYIVTAWALGGDKQTPAGLLGQRGLRPHEKIPIRRDRSALLAYERLSRPNALRDRAAGSILFNSKYPDLVTMLSRTKIFLATNPVDRIYALLGLVCDVDPHDPDFRIEYAAAQTPAVVCQRFAAGLIKRSEGAAVLGMAGTTRQACRTVSDSPSWVPDWTTPIRPNDYVVSLNFLMHGLNYSDKQYGTPTTRSLSAVPCLTPYSILRRENYSPHQPGT